MATRLARPVRGTGLRQHLIARYTDLARRFDRGRDAARFGSPWAVMVERLERREPVEMSGWQVPDEWHPGWLGSWARVVLEPDDSLTLVERVDNSAAVLGARQ